MILCVPVAVGANAYLGAPTATGTTLSVSDTPRAPTVTEMTPNSLRLIWNVPATTTPITSYKLFGSSCKTSAVGVPAVRATSACTWEPALRVTLTAGAQKNTWLGMPDCVDRYNHQVNITATGDCTAAQAVELTSLSQIQETEALCRHSCTTAGNCLVYSYCASTNALCTGLDKARCRLYSDCGAFDVVGVSAGYKYYNFQSAGCLAQATGNRWTAAGKCRGPNDNILVERTTETLCTKSVTIATKTKPLSTTLPGGLTTNNWLQLEADAGVTTYNPVTVAHQTRYLQQLSPGTKYKFAISFTNGAGESAPSAESMAFTTPDQEIKDTVRMSSGPPCVYQTPTPVRFAVSTNGTNVKYRWESPSAGNIGKCDPTRADCSVMTYTFPSIGTHVVNVVAYNTRGSRRVSTSYTVQNCGCADPFDASYWNEATYSIPTAW